MHVFSTKDLAEAKKLLKEKLVVNLFFSEGTYQLEVRSSKTSKETFWPFLQLNDAGEVLDAFCTCEAVEKKGSCPHLAASYLKIMQEDPWQEPLHVRFRESLWNQLFLICSERHGYEPSCLQKSGKGFETFAQTGKRLFFIQPLKPRAQKYLEEILFNRPVETEETSLKFSNLPAEEILLWREGRPSQHLRYELCFWSDLAKWLIRLQEEGSPYKIEFSDEEPPHFLTIRFAEVEIEFYIDLAHWPLLIPTLSSVEAPLKVHFYLAGKLEKILFLQETGEFSLEFQGEGELPSIPAAKSEAIKIEEWLFFPKIGFYPNEVDPLLQQSRIEKRQVDTFFKRHLKLLQKNLSSEKIHPSLIPVRYFLELDPSQGLHIEAFVFEQGDLKKKGSHYFGNWVYLNGKGFFQLEQQLLEGVEVTIPKHKVSDFINRHKVWLHSFEGFQTYVSGVESHLGFQFTESSGLSFFTRLEFNEEKEHVIDLGEWIYVKGKGFYAKVAPRLGAFVQSGMTIKLADISSFIHQHREELEPIPGFFTAQCPLEKTGLNIGFNEEGRIQILPEFFFAENYTPEKVQILGDYTFVEGEGFALIPHRARLPDNYKLAKVIDPLAEPYFVGYELELLYPHVLVIDPRLKRPKKMTLCLLDLRQEIDAKTGQWVLQLAYETEFGRVSPHQIWEGIWKLRPYIFSEAGLIFLRDKRFDWLREKNKKKWQKKGEFLRMDTLEFLRLCVVEEVLVPEGNSKKEEKIRALLTNFLSFKAPTEIDLSGLKSDLRSYQKTGVAWLWFLYSYGLSGLLCDEMGLGKTHQAMALLMGVKNALKDKKAQFLVVCPTSVIYHWEKLIHTFLPHLKIYIFHGTERSFEVFVKGEYDLLLTSYGIIRTENNLLSKYSFNVVIFDELQIAKNEKSMTNKALRHITATSRIGLTGTPIENRLLDLKALFDVVLPTYLPTMSVFRELFVNPIEKYHNPEKGQLLSRLISPFLLRRKKSEVLTELPEKIEEIVLCDLSDEQIGLYREIVRENKEALLKELVDAKRPPPIAHIFSILSKLKQVCNHPSLIKKDPQNYKKHFSGKWDLFLELLEEVQDSGQKLVVFSQYLHMLDIIGLHLTEKKIEFAEIRGSTRDRKKEVERFATDPKCQVFLGSLQAAGVGIDLVAASVVIHYDRWWNPAKENQATDRVHRMGQKRGVQVFKLVTKNTIEEHVHHLIEKKIALTQGVLGFDTHDQIKGFHREELIEILQLLDKI